MNIKEVTKNIIRNYDENVEKYINLLNNINCILVFTEKNLEDCIYNRSVYACSIKFNRTNKKTKILKTVLPIMIGSKLDVAIRKFELREFKSLKTIPNILNLSDSSKFEYADIAITCFLINGSLKQIPFFITNDRTNPHIVKNSIVRTYRYDSDERGKELSYYFDDLDENFKRGDLVVRLNNGTYSFNDDKFFECPYPIDTKTYFRKIFSEGFQIDNLENRIVVSPGHLFLMLFTKNLYVPLRNRDYKMIVKKYTVVVKSIISGDLLHVISKKTLFFKETNTKNKMINSQSTGPFEQREIGINDEVFVDKKSTPYRDANCQYYPYIPYLSHFTNLQISCKVKSTKILSFNNSYIGFLCIYGTSETKNVGRVMLLTRNTFISTKDDIIKVYNYLNIEPGCFGYIVVNSACIPVSKHCFVSVNLLDLKKQFVFIECYKSKDNYIFINYKVGLLYKELESPDIWVTSRDIKFWILELYNYKSLDQIVERKGYDFITSYSVDIIKYFKHNAFPKNILTLNALKNSISAITPEYSLYYCETVSAVAQKTDRYELVLKPENKFSEYFSFYFPRLNLMYCSFKGSTQEDCIVMKDGLNLFNCYRLYTIKIKFSTKKKNANHNKYFYPMLEQQNPAKLISYLGTVVSETGEIKIMSQTMHLYFEKKSDRALDIYFTKPNFKVVKHKITNDYLFVSIYSFHENATGDKICSLHGQKGVIQKYKDLPFAKDSISNEFVYPEILINPYCLVSRQTMGQLVEAIDLGGKDYDILYNSDGKRVLGEAFIGPVFYFPILYLSSEHIYVAKNCTKDKLLGQPVRGRSRLGGMRAGTMELLNCFRGNGIGYCFEEIMLEHSDRIIKDDIPIPQSVVLCNEDANFFKCDISYETEPPVKLIKK